MISKKDVSIVRDLAKKVLEYSQDPDNDTKRDLWVCHNKLQQKRPMVLVFPEGAWCELIPDRDLRCEDEKLREMEYKLRQTVYYAEHLKDDAPVGKVWHVSKVINGVATWDFFNVLNWGLEPERIYSGKDRGAYKTVPVLNDPEDIKKIRPRPLEYDDKATLANLEVERDILGDILDVKLTGLRRISVHLMNYYAGIRGLDNLLLDMYDAPEMIHEVMRIYEESYYDFFRQMEEQNLLSLNNDGTYNSTGGVGYSDEIQKEGFDPDHVRIRDMWGCAESQELSEVSPKMHREFALQYEKRILERFALSGYGCCEPLHDKLEDVFTIRNIRRISISPWADVRKSAQKMKGDYIFSWKPNPAQLCGTYDPAQIREYIKSAIAVCRENGCQMEMVLKDTHTCENRPERFEGWMAAARQAIEETVK